MFQPRLGRVCLHIGLVVAFTTALSSSPAGATEAPEKASGEGNAMPARIERDAAEIRRLFASTQSGDDEVLRRREIARLRLVLDNQRRELRGSTAAAIALRDKVERLSIELDGFERLLSQGSEARRRLARSFVSPPSASSYPALAPTNDVCANAIAISLGGTRTGTLIGATRNGSASCGSAFVSPDAWYKFTAPADGWVSFDLLGSAYDTVLSLHEACPGEAVNELTCNDDAVGLDSAVGAYLVAGQSVRVRVSGFNGATGPFVLHAGLGAAIDGVVTDEGTSAPLSDGYVIARAQGGFDQVTAPDANGHYSLTGLPVTAYSIRTQGFVDHLDELHAEIPCEAGSCDLAGATLVAASSIGVGHVDFVLGAGSSVAGTVTNAGTGDPLAGVSVTVYDADADPVGLVETDSNGHYTVSGLAGGIHYARAEAPGFRTESYDDQPCLGPIYWCPPIESTPISVGALQAVTGIDFALNRWGAVSGTVTDAVTALPIADALVVVGGGSGGGSAITDADGHYLVGGLPAGDDTAWVEVPLYEAQVYQGINCPYLFCDIGDGTPIPVALDATTTGIDFALPPLGTITGTVTDAGTSGPLEGVAILGFVPFGLPTTLAVTGPDGSYSIQGLEPGDWILGTTSDHVDEVYDDVPCPWGPGFPGCDLGAATPITVALGTNQTGVDFALGPGGGITGTLTDAATGAAIEGFVDVFDQDGHSIASGSGLGAYAVSDLPTGVYYVKATAYTYVARVYQGLDCYGECDPTLGMPVQVTSGATTAQINLALQPNGSLTVHVIDAVTKLPVDFPMIQLFHANGEPSESLYGNDITFQIGRPESLFIRASGDGYLTGLYNGIVCGDGCDVKKGTPLPVAPDWNRDVTLVLLPETAAGIAGKVSTSDHRPLAGIKVNLWNSSGQWLASSNALVTGQYLFPDLAAGQYRVSTEGAPGFFDQVWNDQTCPAPGCDPLSGSLVSVGASGPTILAPGVDFHLPSRPILQDGFESGDLAGWTAVIP